MKQFVVLTAALGAIWLLNGMCIVRSIKNRICSEFFMHIGLGLFFSAIAAELCLSDNAPWHGLGNPLLEILGFILYIPSALLIALPLIALSTKGKAPRIAESTVLITGGIFGIIRQPMTLGCTLWAIAVLMVFQSVFCLVLCTATVLCMWIASRTEIAYNIGKFGQAYVLYAQQVPAWNIFKIIDKRKTPKKATELKVPTFHPKS